MAEMQTGPQAVATPGAGEECSSNRRSQPSITKTSANTQAKSSWRDVLPVHPAADAFPMMSAGELKALAEDIKKNGMTTPITVLAKYIGPYCWYYALLDGRNRLAALELIGINPVRGRKLRGQRHDCGLAGDLGIENQIDPAIRYENPDDPYSYVISANIHRRHLTAEQSRNLIATLIKADPGRSDRQIAETVKRSPTTVGTVRAKMEAAGDVSKLDTRTDTKGRAQPARKSVGRAVPLIAQARHQIAADGRGKPANDRAVMASRQEPIDSADAFFTPPWATRALTEKVLPQIGIHMDALVRMRAWEPACGAGHMAEVLAEYFGDVIATDLHNYGYGESGVDFLGDDIAHETDWIITNPPFANKAERFVRRAIDVASTGVAIFVPLRWLETTGRYERLFRDNPPTLIAFFAERVNLCAGRWEPTGSTATAYVWLVWINDSKPQAPFWIPPGCRKALEHPDDRERFTVTPVVKKNTGKSGAAS